MPIDETHQPPTDAVPIDAIENHDTIQYNKNEMRMEQPDTPPADTTPRSPEVQWAHHLKTLPPWEYQLLRNVRFTTLQTLRQILKGDRLVVCSDGGATEGKGSFGAVIAEHSDASTLGIAAELSGVAFGADPGSFRAEAYGMLAGLRLILQITKLWGPSTHAHIDIYCDNQGLITRMDKRAYIDVLLPRHFLLPEADLESLIANTTNILGTTFKFNHVKGHQDEGLAAAEILQLPQPARLNIRCDELATAQLERQGNPEPTVPFAPETKIALSIGNETITHHIPSRIRLAYGRRLQRKFLTARYKWTAKEFDWVHWDILRRSLVKFGRKKRNFFIKRINHISPLMEKRFKYNLEATDKCPSCRHYVETEHHFLRCPHNQRRLLLLNTIDTVTKCCKKHKIDPRIKLAIHFLIRHLIDPKLKIPTDTPPIYTGLITDQLRIGPDTLMVGMLHTQWVEVQEEYLKFIKAKRKRKQAFNGIRNLATLLMEVHFQLWIIRNGHLHDEKKHGTQSYKRHQLIHTLRHLYQQRGKMLSADRDIFSRELADFEHQHTPTNKIRQFIQFAEPIVQRSIQTATEMNKRFRTITHYFGHDSRNDPHIHSQPEPD